jgi:IS30 family transposase
MSLSEEKERYLQSLYYDLEKPGSFWGPLQLWQQVRKENKFKIGFTRIKQWLQNQDVYSMNKAVRRRFKRARVFTGGIRDQYDIDLMDVSFHSKENDGVRFLLVVIDVFTRYAWISPLKNKTSASVLQALKKCFKHLGVPRKVRTDSGKEFIAKQIQNYLKSLDIKGGSRSLHVTTIRRTCILT